MTPLSQTGQRLQRAYGLMRRHYGHQHWWPGDSPFEICVGAILTQNTNWTNVEKAILNLKAERVFNPWLLHSMPRRRLAGLLRPTGYFNIKTDRLRSFLTVLITQFQGHLQRLFQGKTAEVRRRLLAIRGIGPETADSMLLYAGAHLSFVVDAYTKRIFSRHEWCHPDATYEDLQLLCSTALQAQSAAKQLDYWQDYHAQLVQVGKDYCRPRQPRCSACPLQSLLPCVNH